MTTNKSYEVEQHTACDGWTNTWTEEDEHGTALPQTFASRAEAAKAINVLLIGIHPAKAAELMI